MKNDDQREQKSGEKKPYQAPAWEVEETEAEAGVTCAKADDTSCSAGPIQS